MQAETFWNKIEQARQQVEGDVSGQVRLLTLWLAQQSPEEIVAAMNVFEECEEMLYVGAEAYEQKTGRQLPY